jgi:hypothetical protein
MRFCAIARRDVGKMEETRNQAPWIVPLWEATGYPHGYDERQPYCAAGVARTLKEWLRDPAVLTALDLTPTQAEKWRCKSASCFKAKGNNWLHWAREKGLTILGKEANLHTGDLIIYDYSHIEIYTGDLPDRKFTAIGYNTDAGGGRDGDGCFEKPRSRTSISAVIRILP